MWDLGIGNETFNLAAKPFFKSSYLIEDSFPTKMDAKFFGHLLQKYLGELQCTYNDLQVPRGKHAGNLAEEGQEWSLMLFYPACHFIIVKYAETCYT